MVPGPDFLSGGAPQPTILVPRAHFTDSYNHESPAQTICMQYQIPIYANNWHINIEVVSYWFCQPPPFKVE